MWFGERAHKYPDMPVRRSKPENMYTQELCRAREILVDIVID